MTNKAHINPAMFYWGRERAGLQAGDVAKKMSLPLEKIKKWEDGEDKPTFRQAEKFSSLVNMPLGFLFLNYPPKEELPIPDLRVVDGEAPRKPSLNLMDTIKSVIQKQEWYKNYLISNESEGANIPEGFSLNSRPEDVARDIRERVAISELKLKNINWEKYQKELHGRVERLGVLVMKAGYVGSNTRRTLDVEEFRGFAISDPYAPVIFINGRDARSAQLFTLFHELAHIYIGESGVSSGPNAFDRKEEVFCNQVAGEVLISSTEFHEFWNNGENWKNNLPRISAAFHVSQLVVARRALTLGKIGVEQYRAFHREEREAYKKKLSEGSGGNYYATTKIRNSYLLSRAVISESFSGRMLVRDASKMLGVKPKNLRVYAKELA